MTLEQFIKDLKDRLDTNIKDNPKSFANATLVPYSECKQFKMKDILKEASKYGENFIVQKAIHFPTNDIKQHNMYKRQGGIIAYYKNDMLKSNRYTGR